MNRREFYNTLSEDVKTKIKACQTEEEMMRVLAEEKIELDPELLESVSGGVYPECKTDWDECEHGCFKRCGCN